MAPSCVGTCRLNASDRLANGDRIWTRRDFSLRAIDSRAINLSVDLDTLLAALMLGRMRHAFDYTNRR